MSTPFLPWERYPALREARLARISILIRDRWTGVVNNHQVGEGDGTWSRNCRAYERICNAIMRAAIDEPWLTFDKHGLEFTFRIDGVPIRFFRGDAFDPPSRHLRLTWPEEQFQAGRFHEMPACDRFFRLAVEVTPAGVVERITLVELQEPGTVVHYYDIPAVATTPIVSTRPPVDLPKAGVRPIVASTTTKKFDAK